jgi:hypothetical protein
LLKSQHAIRPSVGAAISRDNDNGDVRLQRTAVVQGVIFRTSSTDDDNAKTL